jgi:hypothetical protein
MKTTQFCMLLLLCAATQGSRAQHFYVGLGGGYGFPAAKQSLMSDQKSSYNNTSGGSGEITARPISMGSGINAGLFFGYMLNTNVGFELGISYLLGNKNKFIQEYSETYNNSFYQTESYNYQLQGSMIRLVPTMRFEMGDKKIRPYMKTGMIIGLGANFTDEATYNYTSTYGNTKDERIIEYSGGLSLGFHGGVGINYQTSSRLMLFAECAVNYQNWAPLKSELTKYTEDGVDLLPLMDKNEKEVEYVNSYTYNSSSSPDPNAPDIALKFYMPFSSVGLSIGIVMTFGKKPE